MEIQRDDVQKTMEDIALIKRLISSDDATHDGHWGWSLVTAKVNLLLQLMALGAAVGLLWGEFKSNFLISREFIYVIGNHNGKFIAFWQVGLFLAVAVAVVYFMVYCASKRNKQEFVEYVAKNFTYLKNFSLLSDMFVKFTMFTLLIYADRPHWTFPLFFIFIADYLFQGRVFTLPTALAMVLGVVYLVFGAIQFFVGSWLVIWPLLGFIMVCALSVGYCYKQQALTRKKLSVEG